MTQIKRILTLSLALLIPTTSISQDHQCHSILFPTQNTHGRFIVGGVSEQVSDLVQRALKASPEPVLVQTALSMGHQLGLTPEQQQNLTELFAATYADINRDKQMSHLSSALPYCLSSRPATDGHYFLYVPSHRTVKTETIVFLHGFGGNLLFYLKILKDQFPDHIIVIPSWGATWAKGNSRYIREVYNDIRQRFEITIKTAHLMSISGGGAISFEIYSANHNWFSDLTVFASMPRTRGIPNLRKDLKILMINGKSDSRFPMSQVGPVFHRLKHHVPGARLATVDSDHFFFVSQVPEWRNIVSKSAGF